MDHTLGLKTKEGTYFAHFASDYYKDNEILMEAAEKTKTMNTRDKLYTLSHNIFDIQNRRIYDCTEGGYCKVFPKRDHKELFF